MFSPGSRYQNAGTYVVVRPDGSTVVATRIPAPRSRAVLGYYRRLDGQRLDLIAASFLDDSTAFWVLCDTNGAVVPDALAAHRLVAIPRPG